MHIIANAAEYKDLLATGGSKYRGVMIHFGASWCAPCQELNQVLEESVMPVYKDAKILFAYADVESLGDVCETEDIDSVPFVSFYRKKDDGTLDRVSDVCGAKVALIKQNLVSLFGRGNDDKSSFASLDDYIRSVLSRDKIVVFITGTPSRPRCGFTRKIVTLLDQYNATYSFFDIMSDTEMCERLKSFSNWPTFPQVYVDGELIGGCDVCYQMHEEGALKEALKV